MEPELTMLNLSKSQAYRARAGKCLTISPFSKDPRYYGGDDASAYPSFISEAKGKTVWDVDNNAYTDWVSGLGATLLGHGDDKIYTAVKHAAWGGAGLSLPSHLEVEVAEKIAAFTTIPQAMVRFGKTGSDATAAAVRLARAVTGRELVLSVGFHGWHDTFVAATPPAWGIPQGYADSIVPLPHDVERLVNRLEMVPGVAAVIIEEPIVPLPAGFYADLLHACHDAGALLILDEVVTGFRWPGGSVAHRHEIEPDLVCYGKALANGYALSALVGHREHMAWFMRRDPVFVSTTAAGEPVALAAASVALDTYNGETVWSHVDDVGTWLNDELNCIAPEFMEVRGIGCRSQVVFPHGSDYLCKDEDTAWAARSLWVQEMAQRGYLMGRVVFPMLCHNMADVDSTVQAAAEAIDVVRREVLEGTLMERMKGRVAWRLFRDR